MVYYSSVFMNTLGIKCTDDIAFVYSLESSEILKALGHMNLIVHLHVDFRCVSVRAA